MNYLTESWDDSEFPLAYLITIRTYGTWLNGDKPKAVDKHHGANRYERPKLEPGSNLEKAMKENATQTAVVLSKQQRIAVDLSIRESSSIRGFYLLALNVRTNHLHAVVSARRPPESIIADIKRHTTRELRNTFLAPEDNKIWSRGGSRRYLWRMRQVDHAIDYVLYGQGKLNFE
jgi:REP element-mobilizing transposase RayT